MYILLKFSKQKKFRIQIRPKISIKLYSIIMRLILQKRNIGYPQV